jgi:hypothetical protein
VQRKLVRYPRLVFALWFGSLDTFTSESVA